MARTLRTFAFAALAAVATVTPAAAQTDLVPPRSHTQGFHLGLFLMGDGIRVEDSDVIEAGGGMGVQVGYGFSEAASVFLRVDGAAMQADGGGDYTLAHADLGVRFSFRDADVALRPYVQAALNGRAVSMDVGGSDLMIRGGGFSVGTGVEYFVNPSFAIVGGVSWSMGEFNEGRVDGGSWEEFDGFDALSSRVDLGVSWHP